MNPEFKKEFNSKSYEILKALEVNMGMKGYDYIKEALNLIVFDRGLAGGVISLYERIAVRFNSTPSRVERAIRHFIEAAYYQSSNMFKKIVGNTSQKPANGHFLKALSEYIKYEGVGLEEDKP